MFSEDIRDPFLAARNGLFFKLSLPVWPCDSFSALSFCLLLPIPPPPQTPPQPFSGLAAPHWELLSLTRSLVTSPGAG